MPHSERLPHPALAPFVDRFWSSAAERSGAPEAIHVLPDGCIDLIVRFVGPASRPDAFVVGAMTAPLVFTEAAALPTVAVRFRPGGAGPFLRVPAHVLTDRRALPADLGLGWLALPRLAAAPDLVGASRALEEVLLARLPAVGAPDRRIAHAVRALFGRRPPTVAALADGFGVSRQHLTRAFRQEVGLGPKELARVARAQRALVLAQRRRENLAAVAAHAGYYDEAHMDRDFRALIGMTPAQAQGAAGSIRPILSLLREA